MLLNPYDMENIFTFGEYDEVNSATNDKDTSTKNLEGSGSIKRITQKTSNSTK